MNPSFQQLLHQEVPISWFLMLSAVLFSLGVVGFLLKRNLITVFMSIEAFKTITAKVHTGHRLLLQEAPPFAF